MRRKSTKRRREQPTRGSKPRVNLKAVCSSRVNVLSCRVQKLEMHNAVVLVKENGGILYFGSPFSACCSCSGVRVGFASLSLVESLFGVR